MARGRFGIIPPLTTPIAAEGAIDDGALRAGTRPLTEGGHGRAVGVRAGESRLRGRPRRLPSLGDAIALDNLSACAKYAQTRQGCPGRPRRPMPTARAARQPAIDAADGLAARATAGERGCAMEGPARC